MPVGTHASVRGQRREDILASGAQVLLANTYHLLLRPGPALFEKLGGIHAFMNWPRSVLTDSGGFQIFSLPRQSQHARGRSRVHQLRGQQHYLPESGNAALPCRSPLGRTS